MKKKVLYTASTEIHLRSFHIPYLKWFKNEGYEVHVAYNGFNEIPNSDFVWNIPFGRSPFDNTNLTAFRRLRKIIDENKFDIVHCHTPMASIITRLASKNSRTKNGTKVFYTAHGFHFFKGSPMKNWIIYYPIEIFMSYLTDAIITINQEDYQNLLSDKFKSPGKFMINGIGINPERLNNNTTDLTELRSKLGFSNKDFIILYIAEFIERKNHSFVIHSLQEYLGQHPEVKLIFAGGGQLLTKMKNLVDESELGESIKFIGFVKDIGSYISICSIGISASRQEGMPIGISEIIYNKKPVVVSDERGHRELIIDNVNGFIFRQNDKEGFIRHIDNLYRNKDLYSDMQRESRDTIKKFMLDSSLRQMTDIYKLYV